MPPSPMVATRGVIKVGKESARAALHRILPGGTEVPLRASGVTPQWLENAMGLRRGAIRSVQVVDQNTGTAARARIAVEADDLPNHLFLKFTPHNYVQNVIMNMFDLGAREVFFYQNVAARLPVRTPHCYAARVDARRGRNIMVLEDLSTTARFRDIREAATAIEANAVIDAMAEQHAAFWENTEFANGLTTLTGGSPEAQMIGDLISGRFVGNMKGLAADLVPSEMKQQARIVFERSAEIESFWASQPQTVLHGDPHLGNLFFEGETPGFLDWQVTMMGAGARDVAYFATASVEPDLLRKIERSLVERYASRLEAAGVTVDFDLLWTQYRAGVTAFFVSAVAAAEGGERAQLPDVCRVGVERSVAAVEAHESFSLLKTLIDGRRV